MAFLDFMYAGTYTNIENIMYNKAESIVGFSLAIFTDNTKKNLLRRDAYEFYPMQEANVDSLTTVEPLVTNIGDKNIFVDPNKGPEGDYFLYEIVDLEGAPEIKKDPVNYGIVYITPDGNRNVLDEAHEVWSIVDERNSFTKSSFDNHFGLALSQPADTDLYKLIYNFLKTLPEFANVTDA